MNDIYVDDDSTVELPLCDRCKMPYQANGTRYCSTCSRRSWGWWLWPTLAVMACGCARYRSELRVVKSFEVEAVSKQLESPTISAKFKATW